MRRGRRGDAERELSVIGYQGMEPGARRPKDGGEIFDWGILKAVG